MCVYVWVAVQKKCFHLAEQLFQASLFSEQKFVVWVAPVVGGQPQGGLHNFYSIINSILYQLRGAIVEV